MPDTTSNNKRIAKNTMFLYFRMLLVMLVTLYTTRVLLETLGVEDFGIYNVVGGIVTMFTFLSGTLSSASQRFFSYELGTKNYNRLQKLFSVSWWIYIFISLVVFILAETIGLWFVKTQMTIPIERMSAALWVYQFSIFSFIATILITPYNAAIIAQENMSVYAIVSIIDVVLKLVIVYVLAAFGIDKLKLYALLVFIVTVVVQLIYMFYCKYRYKTYKLRLYWDTKMFKEMLSFAGWNMIGSIANVLRSQGINVLLNMFFNPIVNAARGIAYQVNSAIMGLINNFYTAVRPQIFKYYSMGETTEMHNLVLKCSRLGYCLMFFVSVPLFFEMDLWLSLWLKNVPENAVLFTRIIIVNALLEVFSAPLVNAMQATGNIKLFQLIVSVIYLFNIPISYFLLKMGYPPETALYVNICLVAVSFVPRLILCEYIAGLPIKKYFYEVLIRSILCTFITFVCIIGIRNLLEDFLLQKLVSEICLSGLIVLFVGVTKSERKMINTFVLKRFGKC